ncbi:hypothetical protein HHX47_DHR3000757 [Lentinula edodes]|nr:hypothetical protein HHX47_DHR3000757 [Lentinula edodes]
MKFWHALDAQLDRLVTTEKFGNDMKHDKWKQLNGGSISSSKNKAVQAGAPTACQTRRSRSRKLRGPEGHSIESAHSALLELGLRVGDDNLSHTDIRLYKALAHSTFKGAEYLSTNPSFLVSVALSPTLEAETDFNAWYEEEHISLLSKVPGWQACRRFSLVDFESTVNSVSPPRYLALHAYKDLDGFTTSQFKAATNTSRRTKVMKEIVASERHVYRLQE